MDTNRALAYGWTLGVVGGIHTATRGGRVIKAVDQEELFSLIPDPLPHTSTRKLYILRMQLQPTHTLE